MNKELSFLVSAFIKFLRKELSIPEYSGSYDQEQFEEESKYIVESNPQLMESLKRMQKAVGRLRDFAKGHDSITVSFGSFDALNQISEAPVEKIRDIEVLRVAKPTFDIHKF